ncbi:hypothetical protein K435DRAFT_329479 [Dendrothele bispora CBS 962.96]|uniref:F-box domain-containing protein n=1 Tax=Dendrothele bispora (strain CBS 962.96) TaxID=1314807 RepID=A0A4S8MVH2_DENBC|nr:hypothetical protein K435DRAFT_329479 [Dendrothele bispora CBS 962.96]
MMNFSLQFCSLPNDILYTILTWVTPLDILRLRQTCKYLRDLTLEPLVWISAYRSSILFLPPGPSLSSPVHKIERTLIRAQKLDMKWDSILQGRATDSETAEKTVLFKTTRTRKFRTNELVIHAQFFWGRYLFFGFSRSFELYDLDREGDDWNEPVFRETGRKLQYPNLRDSNLTQNVQTGRGSEELGHILVVEQDKEVEV